MMGAGHAEESNATPMITPPERACLVIADISGYTSYLAGVELDHAQDILADLMGIVVGSLRPRFKLAKLEGDAAFVYMPAETIDGNVLLDVIEGTYFAFRRRLRDIGRASECDCNACIRIPQLDLKFVAHHGTVVRQRMAGREELVGADVIVAHRLLKNSVVEALGLPAYALFSGACIEAMGADPVALGMLEQRESYEIIGEIGCWALDLEAAWQREQGRTSFAVAPKDAISTLEVFMPGPPPLVWDLLTSPAYRPRWNSSVDRVDESTAGGRRGVGTRNHCVHGKDAVLEEILDWRPPEWMTVRFAGRGISGVLTYVLEPLPDGSRLLARMARPKKLADRARLLAVGLFLERGLRHGLEGLAELVAAEAPLRAAAAPDLEAVPESRPEARAPAPIAAGPIRYVG
jgi:uncharacterized protein YndB with AHSA1/START domain